MIHPYRYAIRDASTYSTGTVYESQGDLGSVIDAARRPRRRPRGGDASLTRERIVEAAIRLADEEGAQAISMRRIAAALGAGTMTLYWHVPDREALVVYMTDAALGDVELPSQPSGDWRADLHLVAHSLRRTFQDHRWLAPLSGARPYLLGPNGARIADFCVALWDPLDLDVATIQGHVTSVVSYVVGTALRDESDDWPTSEPVGMGEQDWAAAQTAYLRRVIESGRYPALSRFAEFVLQGGRTGPEARFESGLTCLLDGIAGRVKDNSSRRNRSRR